MQCNIIYCIADDKNSCAMYMDCIAYDNHSCATIAYDKRTCAMLWDCIAYKLNCAMH